MFINRDSNIRRNTETSASSLLLTSLDALYFLDILDVSTVVL